MSRHTYRSPDGRFTFSATTFSGGFPPRPVGGPGGPFPNDPLMPVMRSIFNNMAIPYRQQHVGAHPVGEGFQPQPPGPGYPGDRNQDQPPPPFAATGRLFPRDADHPQPMVHPVDGLGEYVGFLSFHSSSFAPLFKLFFVISRAIYGRLGLESMLTCLSLVFLKLFDGISAVTSLELEAPDFE